jgi:hypothetical protein
MGESTSPGNIIWPSLFALIEIYSARETLRTICVLKTVRETGIDQLEVKWNGEDASQSKLSRRTKFYEFVKVAENVHGRIIIFHYYGQILKRRDLSNVMIYWADLSREAEAHAGSLCPFCSSNFVNSI